MNQGEQKAYDYLTSKYWIVLDLTENEEYFDKDIDFLAIRNGRKHTIEVKWDSKIATTGNMFIETITDIDNNRRGWYQFITADFMFYGDSVNDLFYVFRIQDLKEFVQRHQFESRKAVDVNDYGKIKKVSQGLLVPIDAFMQEYRVQVINLDTLGKTVV